MKTISLITIMLYINVAESLRPATSHSLNSAENINGNSKDIASLIQILSKFGKTRKTRNLKHAMKVAKAKRHGKHSPSHPQKKLRQTPEEAEAEEQLRKTGDQAAKNEQALLVESELQAAVNKKTSALLEKTYLQKKGPNDFLVIKPEREDLYVTVIPNSIYYNIEKKCVNWLDDCSLRGLRSRLLNRVMWPY